MKRTIVASAFAVLCLSVPALTQVVALVGGTVIDVSGFGRPDRRHCELTQD